MNRLIFLAGLMLVVLQGCGREKTIKLKENEDEKMTYYASEKRGYSIAILKHVRKEYIQYAVSLNGNGEIMYVYKTQVKEREGDGLAAAGPTWYLVSDRTDTLYGAKFFDRTILGYYSSSESNFITDNNFKGKSSPYLEEEKLMFVEVAKLMKENKQTFIPFANSLNLVWFKYDLQ